MNLDRHLTGSSEKSRRRLPRAPKTRLRSMRARLTAGFALSTAALALLTCEALIGHDRLSAKRSADALLRSSAKKISGELVRGGRLDWAGLPEEERDLASDDLLLMVVDSNGAILRKSQKRAPSWPPKRSADWRFAVVPAGSYRLVIGSRWTKTERALRSQALVLLTLGGIVILSTSVGAWFLVGRALSPIGRLSRQARTASAESLNARLEPPSDDAEILELVSTLNQLLSRLTEDAAAKGRFYSSASHELRTPLQALSGHLQVALSRTRSPEEYRETIGEALEQTRRLSSLTADLLSLNRIDAGKPPSAEWVDLGDSCDRILCHYVQRIEEKRLLTMTDLEEDAVLLAPPTHVEMAIRNLIDNAVKYADPESELRIRLRKSGESFRLDLFNACEIPAAWDGEKLFEPFYRPDEARGSKTGGNGLGLAICMAIARANRWELSVEPAPGGVLASIAFTHAKTNGDHRLDALSKV